MHAELKADLARFPGRGLGALSLALRNPGFYAIVVHRLGNDIYLRWPRRWARLAKVPWHVAAVVTEALTGIYLAPTARLGPGLYIGHHGGIRVGPTVVLGERCNLSPGVIVGFGIRGGLRGEPVLGDRVYVAAGAKVFGPIRVGSDVAIGANAVVQRDVPDHVTVGGVPARIISRNGSAGWIEVGQPLEARSGALGRRNEAVPTAPPVSDLVNESPV